MIKCEAKNGGIMINVQGTGKEIALECASVMQMSYETFRESGMSEDHANTLLTSMVFAAVEEYNNKHDGGDEPNDASV